jgi:hypothetical protein
LNIRRELVATRTAAISVVRAITPHARYRVGGGRRQDFCSEWRTLLPLKLNRVLWRAFRNPRYGKWRAMVSSLALIIGRRSPLPDLAP